MKIKNVSYSWGVRPNSMKKILVTGCCGVVGAKLTAELRQRGYQVQGLDLIHTEKMMYIRCNIADYRQLERALKTGSYDVVYNTAAEFGRWNGEDYYEQLWMTNAIGTKNIIRLQELLGFKLVHFSSSEVYGDYEGVMKEDVMDNIEIKQLNDYAMTKWVNEMQILNSMKLKNTKTVRVRLFNTYGPGEYYSPYRSVNCRFCYSSIKNLPITVFMGHFRTSTYLDDTINTLCNIMNNFKSGEVYNIGGSRYHTIEELASIIWDCTGADKNLITYSDSEPMTTKMKKVDVSKAISDLGHRDTITLEEGVAKTISWMRGIYK